ncbi:carotenoid oxygenase family protein [Xenorhabdus sp. KJ12.1]|uniref:carotenoid oxygenase family protein n=1 Tax=Xenorhabdus sp. KJ12.1 TaxID=1851571 RepID=UPI000C067029|nr:carotenoid oxygenase family protein [Xenorhabdus sp. KJ12.1]PHM67326.1 Apocarotenoid-15,15'-oxygenase [Xenorhabdus sp. KJ12.1]
MRDFILSKDVRNSFWSQLDEVDSYLFPVEGCVPKDLVGTFYRIGPGRLNRGEQWYNHPFDGDGMICKVTFSKNGVHYLNRHILTEQYLAEEKKGKFLYRSIGTVPDGIAFKNRFFSIKNPANTNVVYHGGHLLALWEGGFPHKINPKTLETISKFDFSYSIKWWERAHLRLNIKELPFSAHPKKLCGDDNLYSFGVNYGIQTALLIYMVDSELNLTIKNKIKLKRRYLVHDFFVTKNYYAFFLSSVHVKLNLRNIFGKTSLISDISSSKGVESEVLLVARDGSSASFYDAPPGLIFHFSNGFEDSDGMIIFDAPIWDKFPTFNEDMFSDNRAYLFRFILNPSSKCVMKEPLFNGSVDYPIVNPDYYGKKNRYIWFVCFGEGKNAFSKKSIVKLDLYEMKTIYYDFKDSVPEEPVFVSKKNSVNEDDGWLILKVYRSDIHKTEIVILDAETLMLVCKLRLPHHIPMGLHHYWIDEVML